MIMNIFKKIFGGKKLKKEVPKVKEEPKRAQKVKVVSDDYIKLMEMLDDNGIKVKEYIPNFDVNEKTFQMKDKTRSKITQNGIYLGILEFNGATGYVNFEGPLSMTWFGFVSGAATELYGEKDAVYEIETVALTLAKIFHDRYVKENHNALVVRYFKERESSTLLPVGRVVYFPNTKMEYYETDPKILEKAIYDNIGAVKYEVANYALDEHEAKRSK